MMWLEPLQQDVRYALRSFARSPLFALTAVVSLAIGIGADATVFTLAKALLLQAPAGVADPHRLVDISGTDDDDAFGVNEISFPNFEDLRARATTLQEMYGYEVIAEPMSLGGADGAERIFGHKVTTNYFQVLGVRQAAGRLFDTRSGEQAAAEQTLVLSHEFWTRRFNQDPAIVGRTVSLNNSPFTIVGIAADGFRGTSLLRTDVWVPLAATPYPSSYLNERGLGWALLRGRLKPGVTISQAAGEIRGIGAALRQQYPDHNRGKGLRLASASSIPGNLAVPLAGLATLVMGFVSLVLVIACANLAGVLLARATARRREIAVRVAIGAGRARIVRQLLTETLVLFVAGGSAGLLLARGLLALIASWLPVLPVPLEVALALDGRVVTFTTGLSFAAAVVCGLVPALQASRPDVMATLKDEGQGASGRSRLRNAFVVSQVALSIVLVAGAAVFARALQKAASLERGFDPYGVELAALDLSLARYAPGTGQRFFADVADRVRHLPGVRDATIAAALPVGGSARFGMLSHAGEPARGGRLLPADWNVVEPRYFSTLRIPLVAGRDFDADDRAGAQQVVIVNQEAARRFWPGQDPIGKVLLRHRFEFRRGEDNAPVPIVVIGVVGDVRGRLKGGLRPQVYLPLQQQYVPRATIVARVARGQRIAAELRQLVKSIDPVLPILSSQTLEEAAAFSLLPPRMAAAVSAALGTVGLLLAAMGIYGVTAYAVALRTREIGIRIALGATRVAVVRMVLRFGMTLVAAGSVAGLLGAAALNAVLVRVFFDFPAMDAIAFAGTAALFALVGICACYTPVRRATRVDPVIALRYE